ncbi:hypothetical protein GQ457_17G014000 [Hibiscus cannabinus]
MRFEVSDEDCTMDNSGTFLKIRFSDRVHNRIGQCMQHVLIVRLLGQSIGYITHSKEWLALEFDGLGVRTQKGCGPSMESKGAEIYDPWMIVEKHHRRPCDGVLSSCKTNSKVVDGQGASRFIVLETEKFVDARDNRQRSCIALQIM